MLVARHSGVKVNEKADTLAKIGTATKFKETESFLDIAKNTAERH